MNFELLDEGDEPVLCDSCDSPAPVAGFDWGPPSPYTKARDRPQRMLCEFCCTTMASRHTEHLPRDDFGAIRAEVWKAAACVFNMLRISQCGTPQPEISPCEISRASHAV